jgi:hypothetical protein
LLEDSIRVDVKNILSGLYWRMAILLIGGNKTGDSRWYDAHVPMAGRLYDEHLAQIEHQGET